LYFIFTKHTFIAKGILCVEDALDAAEARVDGIAVSNHTGRFLGFTPGIAEVFSEIANAVRSPRKEKVSSQKSSCQVLLRAFSIVLI